MNKLNFFGIGPKIALVLLPWLVTSIIISSIYKGLFNYTLHYRNVLLITGIIIMIFGFIFYLLTVKLLVKGLKETKLITSGTYSLCQNPLYTSLILFIIPALSLILNSWVVLTSSLIGYILFKVFIKSEYKELEKFFGEDYLIYKRETPEFFPLPLKGWTIRK